MTAQTKHKTSRRRGDYYVVPKIYQHPLHVHFWRNADQRGRVRIHIGELAEWLGVSYDMAKDNVVAMREDGRLRRVKYTSEGGPVGIFQVADPFTYHPHDPNTHARKHTAPQWG